MAGSASLATLIALVWARMRSKRCPPTEFKPLPPDTRARILVVNTTGIGDTIFCTGPIADLRQSFPHASIAAFVDRRRVSLLAGNSRLDDIVVYPGKYRRVRATIRAIRRAAFDVAMIQHANDPDIVPLLALAGVPNIVGYEDHTFSVLYAMRVPPFARSAGHTMDSRLGLCKAIGAAGSHWHTELTPAKEKLEAARALLDQLGVQPGSAYALNIGGSAPRKRWPADQWRQLAESLAGQGKPVILLGGPDDREAGEDIQRLAGNGPGIHFAVAKLGLMGDVALLSMCRAHVSGDTGLLHAGLALDVPSAALFGPNDPAWTGPHPRQPAAIVVQPPDGSVPAGYDAIRDQDGTLMKLISVDAVLDALRRVTPD